MTAAADGAAGMFPGSRAGRSSGPGPLGASGRDTYATPGGVTARGVLWGGTAGACAGTVLGTAVGFVLGALVGAVAGWAVGVVLGLAGTVALSGVRRVARRAQAGPDSGHGFLRIRLAAGLGPALLVVAALIRFPGGFLLCGVFALVCLAVGAALGPVVAFGPGRRPGPADRPFRAGVLVAGCAAGALGGVVAGLVTAVPVALLGSAVGGVVPVSALAAGGWIGVPSGAVVGLVLAGVRACPPGPGTPIR